MHLVRRTVALVLLLAGCDPAIATNLHLSPTPAVSGDSMRSKDVRSDALAAVERIALGFGLEPIKGLDCNRAWRATGYRRAPGQPRGSMVVCVMFPADGSLVVRVGEGITNRWSPRGDSLRSTLTDTLARFGSVRSASAESEPPNER